MSQQKREGYECTKCGAWCPVDGELCLVCPIGTWTLGQALLSPYVKLLYYSPEGKPHHVSPVTVGEEIDRISDKMERGEPITQEELDFLFENENALDDVQDV